MYHVYSLSVRFISHSRSGNQSGSPRSFTFPEGHTDDPDDLEEGEAGRGRLGSADDWAAEPVHRASLAMAAPAHRDHIKEHLMELITAVKSMSEKSETLLEVSSSLVCV
jgi:hypothetical protein